ncbi:28S ribosomal protein S18b, mitochondrial isoform X1 [Psammomys obesus]|uniref:28S ribosomal protein S18b, mitochondrial isoform X1 n=1 Tax=Psammomys obesus TaxID=48139 RepID=UPI0024532C82|nr:28S ribosomal protein S18b, mitochondrial isoform X1 [Psammomys obesus]
MAVRFPSRLFAPKVLLKKILHPHFLFPLMRTNLGNTWSQKNTRTAMALALSGLATAATTKAGCRHNGPGRRAVVKIKLLGILAPSAGTTNCMLTLGSAAVCHDPGCVRCVLSAYRGLGSPSHVSPSLQNVKLLEQFVCAHSGIIFHAPYTGVCMKQHKRLTEAIQKARECGLLRCYVPQVEPRDADFCTAHGAVSVTPPAPALLSGEPWYPWYRWQQPPERELSRLRRLYQGNLREESGPPPESMPEVPATPAAAASEEQTGSLSA